MSNKRYQIFISSTYRDLQEERRQALQALLNADYIPAGMELFPATDEEQFEYIKRVIDNCDYYLLIVGGCYGSVADDGRSYTEKEFDYACSKGIKVIALVHKDPSSLGEGRRETDTERKNKFDLFRQKVCDGRVVKMWSEPAEIQGHILAGLKHATEHYPAIGWVRANIAASAEVLTENRTLAKENEELRSEIASLKLQLEPNIENIADLDEEIDIQYTARMPNSSLIRNSSNPISLRSIFCGLAPTIQNNLPRDALFTKFQSTVRTLAQMDSAASFHAKRSDFETIMVHFEALGLVRIQYEKGVDGNNYLFALLTELGKKTMTESLVFRKE